MALAARGGAVWGAGDASGGADAEWSVDAFFAGAVGCSDEAGECVRSFVVFDEDFVGVFEEEAVSDDAGHEAEHELDVGGGAVVGDGEVEYGVAGVGAVRLDGRVGRCVGDGDAGVAASESELGVEFEPFESDGEDAERVFEDFDGEAVVCAESLDEFASLDEVDAFSSGVCGDFFEGHGAARAFEQGELRVDFVGAVEEVVDFHDVAEWSDGEVEVGGESGGAVAGGDTGESESLVAGALGEGVDGS